MEVGSSIKSHIEAFSQALADLSHRYLSFDYCYDYFSSSIGHTAGARLEESCIRLWSYLASWGMLRGSSALLKYNHSVLKPLVEYINDCPSSYCVIDIPYTEHQIDEIIGVYREIETLLERIADVTATDTLVTKIMLGVFGNIPAFDQYFKASFKSWLHSKDKHLPGKVDGQMLNLLNEYYSEHKNEIDTIPDIQVKRFDGSVSDFKYSKAKLIDMWGFTKGLNENVKPRNNK